MTVTLWKLVLRAGAALLYLIREWWDCWTAWKQE